MDDNKQLRKCNVVINGHNEKALFHRWSFISKVVEASPTIGGHPGGTVAYTVGIVELENGKVANLFPEHITFTDDTFEKIQQKKMNRKEMIEKMDEYCSQFSVEECNNDKCRFAETCIGECFEEYSTYSLKRMIAEIEEEEN